MRMHRPRGEDEMDYLAGYMLNHLDQKWVVQLLGLPAIMSTYWEQCTWVTQFIHLNHKRLKNFAGASSSEATECVALGSQLVV
jgi:hypothetical protein